VELSRASLPESRIAVKAACGYALRTSLSTEGVVAIAKTDRKGESHSRLTASSNARASSSKAFLQNRVERVAPTAHCGSPSCFVRGDGRIAARSLVGEEIRAGTKLFRRPTDYRTGMAGRLRTLLVTGGCGFIGSQFVRMLVAERPETTVRVLDALTYAGNLANLASVESSPHFRFVHGNICDPQDVRSAIGDGVDAIVNFAAETHVDRSILDPEAFLRTDVLGTHTLLEATREHAVSRYLQVSTDEVYGDVSEGESEEGAPLAPRSPYAASKASGDLQVLAYAATYQTPVVITRGSNTYGPYQFPEKIIPLFITNLFEGNSVPVYGDGRQVRDWMHVEDHARGILAVLEGGQLGNVYNLGGGNPQRNIDLTRRLVTLCGRNFDDAVRYVTDRPGHDRRYAVNTDKAQALGWKPAVPFESGLAATVEWYRTNQEWWQRLKQGAFEEYYRRQYAGRGA